METAMDRQITTKKIHATEITEQESPAAMIRLAITEGKDLDKLEKLLELQERWEANKARELFTESFAKAQSGILAVARTKSNPQTQSKYASLESIIESARPIYTAEGFAVIFYEGKAEAPAEYIRVCADVLHTAGCKETYFYDVPFDGVGIKGNPNMTKIHAKASSVSYGRRYLMCMIWNIPTKDDDGNMPSGAISAEDAKALGDKIKAAGIDLQKFLAHFKVTKLEDIQKSEIKKAENAIESAKKK